MIFWYHVGLVGQIKSLHLAKWQVQGPLLYQGPAWCWLLSSRTHRDEGAGARICLKLDEFHGFFQLKVWYWRKQRLKTHCSKYLFLGEGEIVYWICVFEVGSYEKCLDVVPWAPSWILLKQTNWKVTLPKTKTATSPAKKRKATSPPKREQDCPNNSIFQRRTCQYCIGSFKCDLTPLSVCPGSNFKLASISPWKPLLFPGCFQARLVGFLVDGSASAVELWSPMKLSLLEVLSGRFLKIPKVENCMLKLWIVCFVFCGGSVFENVLGWRVFGMMGGSCDVFFVQSQWLGRKCLSGLLNISVMFGVGYQHIY